MSNNPQDTHRYLLGDRLFYYTRHLTADGTKSSCQKWKNSVKVQTQYPRHFTQCIKCTQVHHLKTRIIIMLPTVFLTTPHISLFLSKLVHHIPVFLFLAKPNSNSNINCPPELPAPKPRVVYSPYMTCVVRPSLPLSAKFWVFKTVSWRWMREEDGQVWWWW